MKRSSLVAVSLPVVAVLAVSSLTTLTPHTAAHAAASDAAPAVSDVQQAQDESTARSVAQTYGHDVLVIGESNQTLGIWAQPDGQMRAQSDTAPARAMRDGTWQPLDETLTGTGGWFAPRLAAVPVRFSSGGSSDLAQVQTSTGGWVMEKWSEGVLPTAVASGDHVTYPGVFPGVDLRLTATPDGMAEVLIVSSAQAAANPALRSLDFAIQSTSVTGTADEVTATANGAPVISASPLWWDSSQPGADADSAGAGEAQRLAFSQAGPTTVLDATPAVTDTTATYPVYVDPEWSSALQHDWYDDRAYPNQSYLDPSSDSVGYGIENGTSYLSRAFYQFQTDQIIGKYVSNASLSVTETWANSCDTTNLELWEYGPGTPGFTWNQEPNAWSQRIDSQPATKGSSCAAAGALGFKATDAAQYASGHNLSSIQLGLRTANESNASTRKHLDWRATLTITYDSYPNTPTQMTVSAPPRFCGTQSNPAYVNGTVPMTVQANATDPDAGQNVGLDLQINNAATGASVITFTTPQQAQGPVVINLGANRFSDATTYTWQTRTTDFTVTSAWTAPCYFVVKNTGPALPSVSSDGTTPPVGTTMKFTFSSPPSEHVKWFSYFWTTSSAATATPPVENTIPLITCNGSTPSLTGAGSVGFVCIPAGANGSAATVALAPIDDKAVLQVSAYDAAGNVSVSPTNSSVTTTAFPVTSGGPDPQVAATMGHRWDPASDGSYKNAPLGISDGTDKLFDDENAPTSAPLTVAAGATIANDTGLTGLDQSVLQLGGYPSFTRSYNGSFHQSFTEWSTPAGYTPETVLGQLQLLPPLASGASLPTGQVVVYSCSVSGHQMTSTSSTCEGMTSVTPSVFGEAFTSAAAAASAGIPAKPVYRCSMGSDHFDSLDSGCEKQHYDGILGYFPSMAQTATTATQLIDSTKSFSVSAWVKPTANDRNYTAVSEAGPQNSGFFLGEGLQSPGATPAKWRFCIATQINATPSSTCVYANDAVDLNHWSYLTGIWDAANKELRIVVNKGANAQVTDAPVFYTLPQGEKSANGTLVIGSSVSGGIVSDQFAGRISDPSIYPGVIDDRQLHNLANGADPADNSDHNNN